MIAASSLWRGSEWPAASVLPAPARGCLSPSKARSGSCPWLATPSLHSFFSQHAELLWVELHPQRNDTLKPYPPATVKVTALGDRSLCRWSAGEVSRVGPDPTRLVSLQNGDRWREGQTRTEGRWGEDGNTTTEAETGVMRLRAKDTEDGREGQGRILLESRQRKRVPRKPDFGLSTSRAERRRISAVSSHPGHRTWLQQPEKATPSAPGDSVHADLSSIASCRPPQVVVKLNFLEAPPPQDGTTLCLHAPPSGLFSGPVLTKVVSLWLPGTVALKFL